MIQRSDRGRRGLSMVEVMIAISVLAFVLLAFLSVIQSSATLSASSRQTSVAAFQLQAALETTFAIPFEDFKQIYNPAAVPDVQDPDHRPGGDPLNWRGHLGSRPNGAQPSRLPDFCQTLKSGTAQTAQNFTWRPIDGWVKADDLPLLNQHMSITWVSQDTQNPTVDWVEYQLTLTWTNYKGKLQSDSITTRRSR